MNFIVIITEDGGTALVTRDQGLGMPLGTEGPVMIAALDRS